MPAAGKKATPAERAEAAVAEAVEALKGEHAADVQEAANAVDAKPASKTEKTGKGSRVDEKLVQRAVQLRKKGLGLVKITQALQAEGFESPTGKVLRPQSVRQWLMKAMQVDHLERVERVAAPASKVEPKTDEKEA